MSVVTVASTTDMLCCQDALGRLLAPFLGSATSTVTCADAAVACADLNPICGNDGGEGRGRSRTVKLSANSMEDVSVTSCSSASATSCSSSARSPNLPASPGQYGRGAQRSTADASKVEKIQPMSNNKPQTKNQGNFKIVGLGTALAEKKKPKGTKGKSRDSQNRTKKEGRSSSPISTRSRCALSGKGKKKNTRPERDLPPTKYSAEKKEPEGTKGRSRGSQNRTKREGRSSSPFSTRIKSTSSGKGKKKIAKPQRDQPPAIRIRHLVEVDNDSRRGRTSSREAPGGRRRSRTPQFSQRGNDIESIQTNNGKVKREDSSRGWGFGSRGSLRGGQRN